MITKYLAKFISDGKTCPACGEDEICLDGIYEDESPTEVRRKVYCGECSSEWTEIYKLEKIRCTHE